MAELAKRYACKICGGVFLVTKSGTCSPVCCGRPMEIVDPGEYPLTETAINEQHHTIENLRYFCERCNLEMIAIRSGNFPHCCGQEMKEHRNRIHALSE